MNRRVGTEFDVPTTKSIQIAEKKAILARLASRRAIQQATLAKKEMEQGSKQISIAKEVAVQARKIFLSKPGENELKPSANECDEEKISFYQKMLCPMRLIPFAEFKSINEIPRSNRKIKAVTLEDINQRRKENFIVFISHRWWLPDGNPPHPDRDGTKYAIIVEACEILQRKLGRCVKIVIWIDFFGIDQDDYTLKMKGINSLPAYISNSDCLLTPLSKKCSQISGGTSLLRKEVPLANVWPIPHSRLGPFSNTEGEYFGRAWCRLELYLGSNAPLVESSFKYFNYIRLEREGRPHFFFYPEYAEFIVPLPELNQTWMEKLSPLTGAITCQSDLENIKAIMQAMPVLNKSVVPLSDGRLLRAASKLFKKASKTKWSSGLIASTVNGGGSIAGKYKYGAIVHSGVLKGSDGTELIVGPSILQMSRAPYELRNAHGATLNITERAALLFIPIELQKFSRGVYASGPTGEMYEGNLKWYPSKGVRWRGYGVWTSADKKEIYKGQFSDKPSAKVVQLSNEGCRHGVGVLHLPDGSMYEGEFHTGSLHGYGIFSYADGSKYTGEFRNGVRCGFGVLRSASGSKMYEGKFENEHPVGQGDHRSAYKEEEKMNNDRVVALEM